MVQEGRPFLVWVLPILIFLSTSVWVYYVLFGSLGTISVDTETEVALFEVRMLNYLLRFLQALIYLAAAVALFMMRKLAFHFFFAAVCIEVGIMVWSIMDETRVLLSVSGGDLRLLSGLKTVIVSMTPCMYAANLMALKRLD